MLSGHCKLEWADHLPGFPKRHSPLSVPRADEGAKYEEMVKMQRDQDLNLGPL